MPTGYTAALHEGKEQSFSEFALYCARAFGACISLRDEPASTTIPDEFVPSTYYAERLVMLTAELERVKAWTLTSAHAANWNSYSQRLASYKQEQVKREDLRKRYQDMLVQVEQWVPPTEDHNGLKEFMGEQLLSSIDFDTNYDWPPPERITAEKFWADKIEDLEEDIARCARHQAEEEERAHTRTEWVQALRASLGETK